MSHRLFRTVFCAALCFGWILPSAGHAQTLMGLFESGRDAFIAQQYAEAVGHFRQLENEFAGESEFNEPTFQRYFISMYGMGALLSGEADVAREQLLKFLGLYYKGTESDALILLGLIQATRQLEEFDELDILYDRFLADNPEHPDFHLIRYERMISLFGLNQLKQGFEEMEKLWSSDAPKVLRFRAKLAALQQLLNNGDFKSAGELLLKTQWDVTHMPEMAVLAISSLKMGTHYMEQEDWISAIRAFRWVPFYQALVDTQRKRLKGLETILNKSEQTDCDTQSSLWQNHYRNLIAQVRSRLEQLEKGEDYTASFLLKYGRCYLFNDQSAEAWVVFRSLALTEGIERNIEEQAWYHWILASHGAEYWDEARVLCLEFARQFPDSELLPKTFYLLARTHQESGDYGRANQVLSDLIERFPTHEDLVEWYISRGFNLASLNENELALFDFDTAIQHPGIQRAFLVKASYWKGVTLSALHEYDQAFEVYKCLIQAFPDHWMFPEFQYRLATVHYSQRNYDEAATLLNRLIKENPDHFYVPEARVLLGDVAMGNGDLDRAIELFTAIDTAEPRLFMYAYFQIGKIYRAREQYALMEQHFRSYLDDLKFKGKSRTSEALYWLGWTLTQQNRQSETIPLYLGALQQYGNDPYAGELIPMIQALELLKKKQRVDPGLQSSDPNKDESLIEFLAAEHFEAWLVGVIDEARDREAHTLYARLQLYEALKLRKTRQEDLARSAIQGISLKTPLEAMDDQLLGEIGLSLAEDGFEASLDYLRRVLIVFPDSPSKALAYFGLATMAVQQQQWDDALKWLSVLEKETPNHPRMLDAWLLRGTVLIELGRYEQAVEGYNDLLKLKMARGVPHVKALLGLARLQEARQRPEQAIPYYQRIYTLYRAYRPYVAKAYLESARLFEFIGDSRAAYRTLQEFMDQQDLLEFSEYATAGQEIKRMESHYREELTEMPDTDHGPAIEIEPDIRKEGGTS